MRRKRNKIAVAFTGFLISALLAGSLMGGLLIWEYATPRIPFETKGDRAFERGDYNGALQYWLKAQDQSGQPGHLYAKMGSVYQKLSNLDRAEICFQKALKKNPEDADSQKQIIQIALIRGDTQTAKKLLSALLKHHNLDPNLLMLSGDLSMLQAEFKTAEAAYEKAAGLLPDRIRPGLKLAICFQEQKKFFEAEQQITYCRTQGIKAPMDLMLAADYYILAENDIRAERYILMAIDSDPGNLEFKTRLWLFYRITGRIKKAVGYLEELIIKHPEITEFKMMLADFYLTFEDMSKTEALLNQLAKTNKDTSGFHLLMGKFWLFKGRYSHAVSYLKTALEKNYGLVSAHYLLGVAYFAGGQGKLAEKAFIRSLTLDPAYKESIFALAALNYKQKNYHLADQYADRFLDKDEFSARAWKIKGLCALGRKNASGAIDPLSRAWHLGDGVSALFFLGQAFEAQGMVKEALTAYREVLEKEPVIFPALHAYVRLEPDQRRVQQILQKLQTAASLDANPAVYFAGAKIFLELKNYAQCQVYLDKAMALKNVPGPFFLLQAALFKETEQSVRVEKTLTECTTTLPQFVDGWLKLSEYYVKQQRLSDALQLLERAIESFPDHPVIQGNLAWLMLEEQTDLDRALGLARRAYDKLPDQAWIMDTLGWAYYHKKIYSQAEWMLAQAEELAPDNGMIQYHQGMVRYCQGKLFQAKTKLKSALECASLDPRHREESENLLAELTGKKATQDIGGNMIFDPESATSLDLESQMPSAADDSEDILKPDWNNVGSF